MMKALLVGAAAAMLAGAGVVEGWRSGRWASEDRTAAAAKLQVIPLRAGDWVGTDLPIDPKLIRVAEASGHIQRVYRNERTGEVVTVLMLCGPSGPIGAHTPEYCYAGLGFTQAGASSRKAMEFDGGHATYFAARFEKPGAGETPLQVCWAWGVDGDWVASESPRRDFALRNVLYKLYVNRPASTDPKNTADPVPAFLAAFLPEVKKVLAPAG